jgi:ribosomal RNA-processing protein 7
VKEHHEKLSDQQQGGITLFVTNFGESANLVEVKNVFTKSGPIETVVFGKFGGGDDRETSFVRVTYQESKAAKAVLKGELSKQPGQPITQKLGLTGVEKWKQEDDSQQISMEKLEKEVDAFMRAFDARKAREEREKEKSANLPDADGFITVTKGRGRKGATDGEIHVRGVRARDVQAKIAADEEDQKKKKKKEELLMDFYRFQKLEARQNQIADLRKKFEEDKRRIAQLRSQRKFRPY